MPAVADKSMVFKIGARDEASVVFGRVATAAAALEKKLDDLDRKHAKPKVTLDTEAAQTRVTALNTALGQIGNKRARVDVDLIGSGGGAATAEVGDLRRELGYLRDVKVKVRVDLGTSEADMAALGAQMASFRDAAATLRVRVDAGTAEADMAALGAQIASFRDVTVNVDLRTDQALTRVALLRTRLEDLRNVQIGVVVNSGDARAELSAIARAARRLNGINGAEIRIKIEVDAGGSVAQLTAIATLLREIRGTTRARVQVDTGNGSAAVATLTSGLKNLAKVAAGGMSIPGLIATVGQVGSLGASVLSLTGVLGLLPAAGAIGAAAIATVAVGLQGFGDALGVRDDAEAFAEALDKLSPAARAAAVAVRDLGPAWTGVRLDVQERLFAGLGDTINRVSSAYLPSMRIGLGGIATELNTGAQGFAAWATEGRTVADVDTILANTANTMRELAPAGVDVAAALTDVAVVGSTLMPELAAGATNATGRFREFVAEARRTGELEQWIRGGISTLEQLGRIAGNTGGILGSVFSASEEAGYGFLDAVEQVTGELDTLLSSVEGRTALVDVFRESGEAVNAALPGVRELGAAALTTTGAFARTDGLEQFGSLVSQTASAAAPLVEVLGDLAGDTLGALAGGASLAVGALTPVVALASGLVTGLGPVAPAVLAAVIAFKAGGAAAAVFAAGAARAAAASAAITASFGAAFVPGSAAAAAGLSRLSTVLSGVGRALPIVGVAAIGVGLALDSMSVSTDDAVAALSQGGAAADAMRQQLLAQTGQLDANGQATRGLIGDINNWVNSNIFGITSVESATAAMEQQRSRMSDLQRAQQDVTRAQGEYQQAVDQFTANSPQARAAAAALADAHEQLGQAEQTAAELGRSHTEQIQAQNDAMRSQISTAFAYEDAVRATGEAHQAAADALAQSGAGSEEYRARVTDLARAIDDQAAAAQAQATALGGAEAGASAYATEILRATDISSGPGRDAFIRLASTMSTAGLAALTSAAEVSGLATEIVTLPDGRTVTVVAAAERAQLDSVTDDLNALASQEFIGTVTITAFDGPFRDGLTQSITTANGTTGTITLDGNNQPVQAKIGETKYTIDATTGVMTIDGNPAPGDANLTGLRVRVDATTGVMSIDGDPSGANASTQAAVSFADGSTGVITIDGNPTTANGKTSAAVQFADGSRGTITVDANQTPANGKISGVVTYANGSTGTVSINARDLASPTISRLTQPTSSTHTIYVKQMGALSIRDTSSTYTGAGGRAIGAYAVPRALGAYTATAYAGGGMRWMSSARAEVVPARQLRIIGDRMQGDEAFIPINRSPRSLSILDLSARRMGFDLVPRGTTSPVATSLAAPAPIAARPSLGAATFDPRRIRDIRRPAEQIGAVVAQLARGNSDLRAQLAQLADTIRARSGVTVNQTFPPGNPAQNGTASAIAIRVATR